MTVDIEKVTSYHYARDTVDNIVEEYDYQGEEFSLAPKNT